MGKIERIEVPPEDRERLERLARDRNTPQKIVWRSRIVLLAGEGMGAVEVATRVGKSVLTVPRWRRRYAAEGVDGLLKDATRPPGRKPLTPRKIKQVVNLTLNEKPPDATHWSERTMAARAGIAPSSVHKIWVAHGLKPHLTSAGDLLTDFLFAP
jgi:transposase